MIKINILSSLKKRCLPTKALMKSWIKLALDSAETDHAPNADNKDISLHVDFVDADTIKALNQQYRKKNYPTNVLSFEEAIPLPKGKIFLGNLVLCEEVIAKEAQEQDKKFQDHLAHILIHGCLHLLKYDHIKASDAMIMEALEIKILSKLGIKNPYE
ncbi:MAG: rRNA maturation RNase YbeY [Gammaproteobacteria bacterium]|jgi:probable rRNA maturation factor|nr:rRNA maturation RNase YbeY [Gammaproteobacteria bacterium]